MKSRQSRRFRLETLETRGLMAGSVVQSGVAVMVTPDPSLASNTAVVSRQTVGGAPEIDVQLNGVDHYFAPGSIIQVDYFGSGASGGQTFRNDTSLVTVALGGSGDNRFIGGSGTDIFVGGLGGSNTFVAGTGNDLMLGGANSKNTYVENAAGHGEIFEPAGNSTTSNTVVYADESYENYTVYPGC